MAYKITLAGKSVVCDTLDDLKALLADEIANHDGFAINGAPTNENANSDVKSLLEVGPAGRAFLKLLAATDVVTDEEARSALGLDDNKSLAAILANIAKVFKAHDMTNVVKTSMRFRAGTRCYTYSVSHDTAAAIKQLGDDY